MNNIDNLFRKALSGQECPPPDRVWKNIEQHLNKRRRVSGIWWYRGIAAAALLALSFGVWELWQSPAIPEVAYLSQQENSKISVPEYGTEITHLFSVPKEVVISKIPVEKKNPQPELLSAPRISTVNYQHVDLENGRIKNSTPELNLKNGTIRKDFIPITSKEALKNNQDYQALLKTEENPVAKPHDKIKIAVSGHFAPAYSSGNYASSVKDTRGYSYSDDQMKGLMNAGGGLKLSFNTGKRFTFQTGLFYSRMGQKTTEKEGLSHTATFQTLDNHERRVATPLGNIIPKNKNVAHRSAEAIVLNSIAANPEETLEQVFGSLSVPLYVRYKLNKDNRILFSLMGGFSGNFIVNNKVYLKNGGEKELLGSTGDIREFNMSTDWGFGIEYPVTQKIKIMVEPGFKYYLQSLSRDNDIDFKPYLFTLSTGIGIEF